MKLKSKILIKIIGLTGVMTPIFGALSCGETKKANVGMTVYTAADNFTATITNGFKEEAKKLGFTVNLQDSANDQTKQMTQIKSMIEKGVKVLVINLADLKAGLKVINEAKKANIPLILYNREAAAKEMGIYNKVWHLGAIDRDSGKAQAQTIYNDLLLGRVKDRNKDGILKYAMVGGENGHPAAIARTTYSQSELRKLVKTKGVNAAQFAAKSNEDGIEKIPSNNPYMLVDKNYNVFIKAGITNQQIERIFGRTFAPNDLQYTNWGASPQTQSIISALIKQANGNNNGLDFMVTNADTSAISAGKWAVSKAGGFKKFTSGYENEAKNDYLPIYGVDGRKEVISEIIAGNVAGTVFQDGEKQGQGLAKMTYNIMNNKPIQTDLSVEDFNLSELDTNTKAIRAYYYAVNRKNIKNGLLNKASLVPFGKETTNEQNR